jgi:DNA-binding winged helix-turn-helix (wHTH) protein/Tol biopolymer transport system component
MKDKDLCCYEFSEFRLDARRRALSKNGEKVPLSARNFDLLLFMVKNGGRILEHDELLDKVWAGTFVEQATLKKGISALRQILAEKPENEFIKTIPRRGYSFTSPVRVVPEQNENYFIRETEREIIIEEYEETGEASNNFEQSEKIIKTSFGAANALPSAEAKKSKFIRPALLVGTGVFISILTFFGLKPIFTKVVKSQFSVENVRVTRITNSGKVVSGVAVSADGTYLLYPTVEKDGVALWVRQTLANSANKLTASMNGNFWGFAIAPDNSYVYYIFNDASEPEKSGLYKIPLLGGEPQRIAENVSNVAISPDSKRIALVRVKDDTRIFTINTDGEDERTTTNLPADSRLWGLSWTPDGTALLCTIRKIIGDKRLFYASEISPETGNETIVLPAQEKPVFGASWMPDKSSLLLVMRESNADIRQIWQYFPASSEFRRVTNDNNSYQLASLTRDGKNIVATQQSRLAAIWLSKENLPDRNITGGKQTLINRDDFRQITDGINNFDRLSWLADGRLIYSGVEDTKETIFTINAIGANARPITNGEDGIWIFPNVANNGQNVCFISSRSGTAQAWRIDADGKNAVKMTEASSQVNEARILRDNSTVIYLMSTKSDGTNLFRQTADGQIAQLTESDTGAWAISPDEKLFAAEILDKNTHKYHVELHSLADGKIIKTFDFAPVRQMIFTPDGRNLSYDAKPGEASQIMLQPIEGGAPYALTDFQADEIFSFDWSKDGMRLAIIRGRQPVDAVLIKAVER